MLCFGHDYPVDQARGRLALVLVYCATHEVDTSEGITDLLHLARTQIFKHGHRRAAVGCNEKRQIATGCRRANIQQSCRVCAFVDLHFPGHEAEQRPRIGRACPWHAHICSKGPRMDSGVPCVGRVAREPAFDDVHLGLQASAGCGHQLAQAVQKFPFVRRLGARRCLAYDVVSAIPSLGDVEPEVLLVGKPLQVANEHRPVDRSVSLPAVELRQAQCGSGLPLGDDVCAFEVVSKLSSLGEAPRAIAQEKMLRGEIPGYGQAQ